MGLPEAVPNLDAQSDLEAVPAGTRSDSLIALVIIILAAASLVFFRADDTFGAMALRAFYPISSIGAFLLFLLSACAVLVIYKDLRGWQFMATALFSIALLVGVVLELTILASWVANTALLFIPIIAFRILLGLFCIVWLWANLRYSLRRRKVMRLALVGVAIVMAVFVLGAGHSVEHYELNVRDQATFDNHYVIVIVYWGWLGDPDRLTLYDCNQYALACAEVYVDHGDYRQANITLSPLPDSNGIAIRVDGNLHETVKLKS